MALITKHEAKGKICMFFTEEWPATDASQLDVVKIADGFCNTVHIVKRNDLSIIEPAVVILRHYGGNRLDMMRWVTKNKESEEILIAMEMSDKGWGPTVYGVFSGGRVEEYIDTCCLIEPQLLRDDRSIALEIARSYARFHSIQLPLSKGKFIDFRDSVPTIDPKKRVVLEEQVKSQRFDLVSKLAMLLDWNTSDDKKWLFQVFEKQGFRQGLAMTDANYLNILLRRDRIEGRSFIVLIDYELAAYGYTAIDMGGHLLKRQVNPHNSEEVYSGFDFPSMEEIRDFVTAYADECQVLGTLRQQDSIDSLVKEALYGCLLWTIYIVEHFQGNVDMIARAMRVITGIKKNE